MTLEGVGLALAASASLAANRTAARAALLKSEVFVGVLITQLVALPFFGLLILALNDLPLLLRISPVALGNLVAAGILHFVLGRTLSYGGLKYIGANRAGPLVATQSLYSVLFGVLFLREPAGVLTFAGAGLIVFGAALITTSLESNSPHRALASSQDPRGLLMALGAGLVFGITPVFVRVGVTEAGSPFVGSFLSYIVAAIVYLGLLARAENRLQMRTTRGRELRFFLLGATFVNMGQLFRYVALGIAPVIVVGPVLGVGPLFVLLFTRVFLRRHESFHWKVIAGVIAVVVGVPLVSGLG